MTLQELSKIGQQYVLEEVENVIKYYNISKYGVEQFIDDVFTEASYRLKESLTLDQVNELFYNEVCYKLQEEYIESLDSLTIEVCRDFLDNTVDLAFVNDLLKKYNVPTI